MERLAEISMGHQEASLYYPLHPLISSPTPYTIGTLSTSETYAVLRLGILQLVTI